MGRLSTHVLDTANGQPAEGVSIELFAVHADGARHKLTSRITNADGRTDEPLLSDASVKLGTYELLFHIGAYFRAKGHAGAGRFLDVVPIRFTISDADGRYHVPLVCSPWSYSTYRGS
jgi:5-hydroxyisourate hydrolase/2-oxo-4-hydroxy-4-carboxy-5-ureidoimidazoline decarboxylase